MGALYASGIRNDASDCLSGFNFIFWRVEYGLTECSRNTFGRVDHRSYLGRILVGGKSYDMDISSNMGPLDLSKVEGGSVNVPILEIPYTSSHHIGVYLWHLETRDDIICQ